MRLKSTIASNSSCSAAEWLAAEGCGEFPYSLRTIPLHACWLSPSLPRACPCSFAAPFCLPASPLLSACCLLVLCCFLSLPCLILSLHIRIHTCVLPRMQKIAPACIDSCTCIGMHAHSHMHGHTPAYVLVCFIEAQMNACMHAHAQAYTHTTYAHTEQRTHAHEHT